MFWLGKKRSEKTRNAVFKTKRVSNGKKNRFFSSVRAGFYGCSKYKPRAMDDLLIFFSQAVTLIS
jgi:hypothetical protein